MKKQGFFFLMLPLLFAFVHPETIEIACSPPVNVHVTDRSAGSVTFDWNDYDGGAPVFKVKYVRHSDGYNSPEYSTSVSGFTFSGLPAGTYTFYFKTDCGGEVSNIIGVEDIIID